MEIALFEPTLEIEDLARRALAEDLGPAGGSGDVTSKRIVRAELPCRGRILAKQGGVLAGTAVAGTAHTYGASPSRTASTACTRSGPTALGATAPASTAPGPTTPPTLGFTRRAQCDDERGNQNSQQRATSRS